MKKRPALIAAAAAPSPYAAEWEEVLVTVSDTNAVELAERRQTMRRCGTGANELA